MCVREIKSCRENQQHQNQNKSNIYLKCLIKCLFLEPCKCRRKEKEMSNSEDSQQYLNDMLVKEEDEASGGKRNVNNNQCFGAA